MAEVENVADAAGLLDGVMGGARDDFGRGEEDVQGSMLPWMAMRGRNARAARAMSWRQSTLRTLAPGRHSW